MSCMLRQPTSGLELSSCFSSYLCCSFACVSEYEENECGRVSNALSITGQSQSTYSLFLSRRANLSTTKFKQDTNPLHHKDQDVADSERHAHQTQRPLSPSVQEGHRQLLNHHFEKNLQNRKTGKSHQNRACSCSQLHGHAMFLKIRQEKGYKLH